VMNSRPTKKPDMPRGPFKELRSGMAKMVESKGFLAVVSFLVALMAWGALVASDGSIVRHKTFQSVPVSISGEANLKSRGYIVMDDLKALVPSVKLTVGVTQQNYNRISGTSYNPHFDLTDIATQGENELQISFSSLYQDSIVSCEPSSVKVNVERYMTRRIPVVLEMEGEIGEGVYLDSYKLDPTMLSVSGPQSLVLKVTRAVARLDRTALSPERMEDRSALSIELQDSNGNVITSDKLEVTNQTVITNSIVVDTELVPMRSVPLLVSDFVKGEPAEGFELKAVRVAEESLPIAAEQNVLDMIEFVTTDQPMSIEGAQQSVNGYVRLKRPGGIKNAIPAEIAVTAEIEEKTIERTLRAVTIDVDGMGDGRQVTLKNKQAAVQLTGRYGFINDLKKEDVRLFVNVDGLVEGEHVLPVQIHIDNAEEFSCALSVPEITVTIKAQ